MIINELGRFIKIDEIHHDAKTSELYFLSSTLGFEMLSLSETWKGRIYTSKFIHDVLLKKKPKVHSNCLRVLKPNIPIKFKSKDKIIWVTMFEPDDIKSSVMFYFDDSNNTYLYIKAFNDISSCCKNEQFLLYVQKGIDYVYMDTTLSRSNPYISAEEVIEEIKTISLKHQHSKLALIIPNFGYEKLLVGLIQAFPQNIFPTKTQRYILHMLGYDKFLGQNYETCDIVIYLPGIRTEDLESTVYITVGSAPVEDDTFGAYQRQWSPLLCLADQQILLEIIKPNHIVSTEKNVFFEQQELPFSLRWFAQIKSDKDSRMDSPDRYSTISCPEQDSVRSYKTDLRAVSPIVSLASTEVFEPNHIKIRMENLNTSKDQETNKDVRKIDNISQQPPTNQECTNLVKSRKRVISRFNSLAFIDSSEEFE